MHKLLPGCWASGEVLRLAYTASVAAIRPRAAGDQAVSISAPWVAFGNMVTFVPGGAACRLAQAEAVQAMPSARLWLGNISNQVTAPMVRAAFEGFGAVVDAAAFPARIGPLGYAIVVFDRVRHTPLVCFAHLPASRSTLVPEPGCRPIACRLREACEAWARAPSGSSGHVLT